eukprot:GAFH01005607.1.p2 GENE.GAFH01005607.1~~GAFH01005607.1.p2  ORF type:complete len:173 (-),score=13.78 GAFH01005607.1:101-619(-)
MFKLAVLLTVALLVETGFIYKRLPDQVIIHWNYQGIPDGFGTKTMLLSAFLISPLLTMITMTCMALFIEKIPDQFINIPNKPYFLAPERRHASLSYVKGQVMALANGITIYNMALELNAYLGNAQPQWRMGLFTAILTVGLMAWICGTVVLIILHFRVPRAVTTASTSAKTD